MVYDRDGFLYPEINEEKCSKCAACLKSCPQNECWKGQNCKNHSMSYLAIAKNRHLEKKSASGGIFASAALWFLQNFENSYVCGAAFDNGRVCHILISKPEEICRLQGSKYVQSELRDIFIQIQILLESGRYILFSGTPCQCSALKKYMEKKDTRRLLIMDIICHGVPNMEHLQKDLEGYLPINKITDINFREKQRHCRSGSAFALRITQSIGTEKVILADRDPFFNLFMQGKNFRTSCYHCLYACLDRTGDITMGDCDSHKYYPDFHPYESVSAVMIHSEKGKQLWENMKGHFDYAVLNLEREAAVNKQLSHPFPLPEDREKIMSDFRVLPIKELRKRYARARDLSYYTVMAMRVVLPERVIKRLTAFLKCFLNRGKI